MKQYRLSAILAIAAFSSAAFAQQVADQQTLKEIVANDSLKTEQRMFMGQEVPTVIPDGKFPGTENSWWSKVRASGAVQTEFLIPQDDPQINTKPYDAGVLNNTYFDLTVSAPYIAIGGRFEWAKWPLPGYDNEFKGWGVPYIWATGNYKWAQLTVGDFYEQFGSGLILRTYQERSLGVDNAIRGARLKLNPVSGVYFTALGGKQRRYWEHNDAWLWGADAEWSINESFRKAFGNNYGLSLGFSYVGKAEPDEVIYYPDYQNRLRFPKLVAAFDGRIKLRLRNVNILAEAAYKNNDPSKNNYYTFRPGHAELLSITYSRKGLSAYVQAKRSENMAFRSWSSDPLLITSFINHLPAFTMTQTYALAAMYPYATQTAEGEWAFQAEVRYLFKKGTALGGKYGTNIRLTGSYIASLDRPRPTNEEIPGLFGTDGPAAPFWKMGPLNYADVNLEINKKFSSKWQFTLFYMYQRFNQAIIQGHAINEEYPSFNTNIFILEGQWKITKKAQLRFEAQYLTTKGDLGDWIAGLVEFSLAPHWMFTITDEYNLGTTKLNYYNAMVTYNYKANRFTLGYGRTRDGFNCSGGVCRWVPACKGFTFTYNYTF